MGVCPWNSTVSAQICAVGDWLIELESNNSIWCVFVDLKKTFDSVPHLPLL